VSQDGETVTHDLATSRSEKTLVLQAIPSMYAGRDAWLGHGPRAMDDGKLEVIVQGGILSVGLLQIGLRTGRPVCQASKVTISTSEPAYLQVDGEGKFVNDAGVIVLERNGTYPMVFKAE
jgi:hypothetical protein